MFSPAKSRRSFEDVVSQVERAVHDGQLKPGEKLPPERELIQQFAISRGTLREALRILEYSGLIAIRKGRGGGAVISPSSGIEVAHALQWLRYMKRVSLQELAQFRERIEGGAARDAAQRATRGDLEALGAIVAELRSIYRSRRQWPRILELDIQFHLTVAEASHNVLNYTVMSSIIDCMRESFNLIPTDQGERVYRDHARLLRLIRRREATRAEAEVRRHIRHFTRAILARNPT